MTVPKQGSKFDMRLNPVYQVDWSNQASGKVIAASKRRVRFRFGFSDAAAVHAGETGPACRGEEHDVVLVWSLLSGKRLVTADNREIHFSLGNVTENVFETSWTMAGGHVVKLVAYATPPLFYTPGFRQFDLFLDGCSFFDMPKIFELGTMNKPTTRSIVLQSPQLSKSSYRSYSSEPRQLSERPTLEKRLVSKSCPALDTTTTSDVVDLLSMEPVSLFQPNLLEAAPASPAQVHASVRAPTAAVALEPYAHYTPVPPPQQQAVAAVSPPPTPSTYQPQSNYYNQYQQQQQSYYAYPPQTPTPVSSTSIATYAPTPAPHYTLMPVTPMTPTKESSLSMDEGEARDAPPPVSPLEKLVRSLVNLDDIAETIETPEQRKFQQIRIAKQPVRSQPLPPTTPDWTLGLKPRLGDIQQQQQQTPPKPQPAREIMRTHAFDPAAAQAGMMVPYGATTSSQDFCYSKPYGYYQPMYAS